MVILTKKVCLGWGLGGLVAALCALGQSGCSDDSAAPSGSDASADVQADALVEAGPPPLGVPLATCGAGCPVCGGILGSPTTGITYCTQVCTTSTDCPSGTACVANASTELPQNCLKTCASNTDCTAPFICRSDLKTPGSFCWTPYPAPGAATSDAGDAAVSDTGAPVDTGAPPSDGGADAPSDAAAADATGE